MSTLTQAHHQWATRPEDERFTSLDAMLKKMTKQVELSREEVIDASKLVVQTVDDGRLMLDDGSQLLEPSAWAFDQLSYMAEAPAGYLRKLPASISAQALNHGLKQHKGEVGILARGKAGLNQDGTGTLSAVTGPNYGRIWNRDVVKALRDRFDPHGGRAAAVHPTAARWRPRERRAARADPDRQRRAGALA